jgi:hypothetical protein
MLPLFTDVATGAKPSLLILCVLIDVLVPAFCVHAAENQPAGRPVIEYLGTAEISGNSVDLSGLSDQLENGEPHNRLGGISALEYTGKGSLYIALPDRGPDDGATGYACRFHLLDITVSPGHQDPVVAGLKQTNFFVDPMGRKFSGSSAVLDATSALAGRLDPEGCRHSADGTIYVSDEYGPHLLAFDMQGREIRRYGLPDHLMVAHRSALKDDEIARNLSGRASNRGMEGLAISPDQTRLYGIMQSSLLQDAVKKRSGKVHGQYARIVEVDIASGDVREFAYPMADSSYGVSEILACGPGQFLVLERDSEPGTDAAFRQLVWIDLKDAVDISSEDKLPADHLPAGIRPVLRRPFLDFLSPDFPLAGPAMPEKIEGITFGPALPDGRKLLLVSVDNDFEAARPTLIWAFAFDPSVLN